MKKISKSTFMYKKVGPLLTVGFLGIFITFAIVPVIFSATAGNEAPIVPLFMVTVAAFIAIYTFYHYKKVIFPLADEVFDEGRHLKFKRGAQVQNVRFEDIVNINYDKSVRSLEIITKNKGNIGTELSFLLPTDMKSIMSVEKHPIYLDLMERREKAQNSL